MSSIFMLVSQQSKLPFSGVQSLLYLARNPGHLARMAAVHWIFQWKWKSVYLGMDLVKEVEITGDFPLIAQNKLTFK